MKNYGFPLILVLALAQVGCASIMSGTSQEIWVGSSPPGAVVSIDGQPRGETPLVTEVSRKRSHEIQLHLDGYEEETRVTYKGNNNMVLWNILIGGLIGLAIDYSTGAAYSVDPDQFAVRLTETGAERREADRAAKVPAAQPVRRPDDEVPK